VVGTSGSLLLNSQYGAAIDSHSFVFRIGGGGLPPNNEDYDEYIGRKAEVHIVNSFFKKQEREAMFILAPLLPQNVEYLGSLSSADSQINLRIMNPRFLQHMEAAFGSSSSSSNSSNSDIMLEEAAGILLALNTCRSITIFGIAPLSGMPAKYYDVCGSASSAEKHQKLDSWLVLKNFQEAGVIEFGEPCILECSVDSDRESCELCRKQHNVDLASITAAMKKCSST
jgi:Glycosyltransferase family 29 (sialyltransferase)